MQDLQLLPLIKVLPFIANFPKQRRVTYVAREATPAAQPQGQQAAFPAAAKAAGCHGDGSAGSRRARADSRGSYLRGPAGPPPPAPRLSPGVRDRGSPAPSPVRNRDHHSHAEAIKHFVSSVKLGQQMAKTSQYAAVAMPTKPLKYSASTVLFTSTITKQPQRFRWVKSVEEIRGIHHGRLLLITFYLCQV